MTNDVEHFFTCFLDISVSSLEKYLFKPFASFSNTLIILSGITPCLLLSLASMYLTVCYGDLSMIFTDVYRSTSLFLSTYSRFHSSAVP